MMHVLPCDFYKIRYYGIFANKLWNDMLDMYLSLNDKEMEFSSMEGKNWQELVQDIFGYDPFLCKKCKNDAHRNKRLSPTQFYTQSYLTPIRSVLKYFIPTFGEAVIRLCIKYYLVMLKLQRFMRQIPLDEN